MSAVFAPYCVNHYFVSPTIIGLYLIQRASGFICKKFKAAVCHKLADVFNAGKIISWRVKFLPY